MDTPYPPSPPNVPADLARPGAAYRRHTWAAVLALVAFVALYGGLLGWLARAILLALDSLGGRETGVAIAVLIPAIFLGAFLVKGLFFIRRGDVGDAVEVTRTDEPKLFVFLDRLADEVGSPRPHRVFLAPEVNAAVFYRMPGAALGSTTFQRVCHLVAPMARLASRWERGTAPRASSVATTTTGTVSRARVREAQMMPPVP